MSPPQRRSDFLLLRGQGAEAARRLEPLFGLAESTMLGPGGSFVFRSLCVGVLVGDLFATWIHGYIYIYICVYVYIYMCIYMCIYIFMYTYIYGLSMDDLWMIYR